MQFSVALLAAVLPGLGLAAPAGQAPNFNIKSVVERPTKVGTSAATNSATPNNGNNGVTDTQLLNAVNGWMNDTGKVTNFLNTATSLTGNDYTIAATIALNAEKDELNHKAVLDAGLDPATIQAANDTLATQGNFQAVVDALQAMVNEGPETAQQRVTEINNNRCVNVLPNINAYMAAAGQPMSSAIVPTGCLEVAATNPGSVIPSGVPNPNGPGGNSGNGTAPAAGGNNGTAPANGNGNQNTTPPPAQGTPAPGNNNQNNGGNNNNNNNNGNNGNGADATQSASTTSNGNGNGNGNGNNAAATGTSSPTRKPTPTPAAGNNAGQNRGGNNAGNAAQNQNQNGANTNAGQNKGQNGAAGNNKAGNASTTRSTSSAAKATNSRN